MDEWTRLTPGDEDEQDGSLARYRLRDGTLPHYIRAGCWGIVLSDPELLALAQVSGVYRRVPDVQAAVEAVGEMHQLFEELAGYIWSQDDQGDHFGAGDVYLDQYAKRFNASSERVYKACSDVAGTEVPA